MSSEDLGAAASTALAVLLILALCAWAYVSAARKREVAAHSTGLATLARLNATYLPLLPHLPRIHYSFEDRVNSKAKFDRYDLNQFLLDRLAAYEGEVQRNIDQRLAASRTYAEYAAQCAGVRAAHLGKSTSVKLSPEVFSRVEAKLFDRRLLRAPDCSALVVSTVTYTSPKGQNSYSKSIHSDFDQLCRGLNDMRRIREERGTTQFLRARERSKMTASLRTDVLRRDGSRCRMCGRSANDGVKLHVDHIVAVSNGGTTTLANLQTLCEDCNLGKSNRF